MKETRIPSSTKLKSPSSGRISKMEDVSSLLLEMDLFKGFDPGELADSFAAMETREYPAGSLIFAPGEASCERLYILRKGRVGMYRLTANGKRLITRQIKPDGIFGVRGLLGRAMQRNFAEAVENSTVCIISRDHFLAYLERRPELMLRVLKIVCDRLRLLEERLVETVYNPVNIRLVYFLLSNADPVSGLVENVSHEEIGSRIGAVRQTVTETLGNLRKQSLILVEPKKIRIIDRRGLEKVIQGTES